MRVALPVLLAAVITGCAGAPEHEATTARPVDVPLSPRIVNGQPSTAALDSVVFLGLGQGSCTGTFLAPNLILTARHCIAKVNEDSECGSFGANIAPSSVTVSVGQSADGTQVVARGSKIFTETQNSGCGFDIALLLLDRDVPGAQIASIRLTAVKVGERAKAAGYGDDGSGKLTAGRFERGGITVDSVGPASFTYKSKSGQSIPVTIPLGEIITGESTCFGDSGGPLFDESGNVIGVTSRGVDDSCIDRPSIYSDTTSHAALVKEAAAASGHALKEAGATTAPEAPKGQAEPTSTEEDEAAEDDEATPKKRRPTEGRAIQSAGCTTSPARAGGESLLVVLLVTAALLAARRRA